MEPSTTTATMDSTETWSWTTAIIGVASATATAAAVILGIPKDPVFHVDSISLSSLKLSIPYVDAELIVSVNVTNPNIVPISYSDTTMSIFYDGSLLGLAQVPADSQPARSTQLIKIPGRLDGHEMAHHVKKLLGDVARKEMKLDAAADIKGAAKVLWWEHPFKVHVDSHIVVDPVSLDVIQQENKPELDLFVGRD